MDLLSTESSSRPDWLVAELRSDHAGETGAVFIYRGMLAVSRDPQIRRFAEHHLETEQQHLELMEQLLPRQQRSRLLVLWRLAGWFTGALPALFGRRSSYATIAAVEQFVDEHYQAQIDRLDLEQTHPETRKLLDQCREDEVGHRDEALAAIEGGPGPLLRTWCAVVDWGSRRAVSLARLV